MSDTPGTTPTAPLTVLDNCWASIGVQGDGSCPDLPEHVHCRNCPVYSSAARQRLDTNAPPEYHTRWTAHVAKPRARAETKTESIVIFRVGSEWLALPPSRVTEVTELLPIHTLPHQSGGAILGLASVRGELLICVSLGILLGLESAASAPQKAPRAAHRRFLVIRREQVRAVCPVDEVYGIHRFHAEELKPVPATVARATVTYSRALLPWHEQSVGLLDDAILFHTLRRNVA
jgi:chemotaxis-related protein WspD